VIGRAGSGKTTYALRLGRALGLPVTHLDAMYWTQDWREVDRELFESRQNEAVQSEDWVIDGGYLASDGWRARAERADVIVIAEAPLIVCLWRVVQRAFARRALRPDRAPGGGEQLSLYFLWWTATWGVRHRHLARRLEAGGHRILLARNARDLDSFIADVRAPEAGPSGVVGSGS
jgi:adenylate kinase family enzyme